MFEQLIFDMVVAKGVDPNRVYIMGYSAGGDGVYQLAPRMADRWAAAAMMAGHPNESSPVGLRNTPFAIFVGGLDRGFHRNEVAFQWKEELARLQRADPQGYPHEVTIYPDKGHWMDRKDAAAIPWLASHTRTPHPTRVVWHQDDVLRADFYWMSVDKEQVREDDNVVASVEGQTIRFDECDPKRITVRLSDQLVDLDHPLRITRGDRVVWEGEVKRTIGELASSLEARRDPHLASAAKVELELAE
jgi:poly(3-hydroxybutyrate) depolymerase